ncbi:MAG: SDR family oxidoreductase [Myxococcales bacterium]|nr:SDR family oxidoreductase [Myxococcales bacterium]
MVVFGATGGIGHPVVELALKAGHSVVAVTHGRPSDHAPHPKLQVTQGDVVATEAVAPLVAGADAVVLALGVARPREPTTLFSEGARTVLSAMQHSGVRRLLAVSASGFVDSPDDRMAVRILFKPLLQRMLRPLYDDLKRMEAAVTASRSDWTLVRPARLVDGPRTGVYRTCPGGLVPGGASIARADVADFLVKRLEDPQSFGSAVGIAY